MELVPCELPGLTDRVKGPGVIPCSSLLNCSAELASLLGDPCLELWKGDVSALKPLAPTRLHFFPQMHLENLHLHT